jgi:integrase/recombinase XerD
MTIQVLREPFAFVQLLKLTLNLLYPIFVHMTEIYSAINTALNRIQGAYAPNTLKSYYADARSFVDWCGERNVEPFPLRSKALCAYIEYLQEGSAYSSIRRRISSLRRLNKLLEFEDQTQTENVYLTIRRLKRSKCLEQRQAVGINHDVLIKMIAAQPDTLAGTRNRALLSLGYDFLARRSELVAIRSDNLKFTPDGALKGMIRKSKTDQYGKGRLVFGSERSAKLVRKWLRLKPKDIQPVFCAIKHKKCEDRAICDRNVNDIIKRSILRVKRCERPSDLEVSGHSLRVGAAQDLLIKGYDLAAIMRAGGWSDPSTVSRYLRFSQHNIWK